MKASDATRKLSATQIGAIAENLIANELMIESKGRLSPFQPVADDDGIDVLIYDKDTGKAVPIQIKARTNTVRKRGSTERGNIAHFIIKKSTHRNDRHALLLCVLLSPDLRSTQRAWLMPLNALHDLATVRESTYVVRASKLTSSNDKYKKFRCENIAEISRLLIRYFEGECLPNTHFNFQAR
ncbi:MAG: hypothetical protein EOO52_15745 [Gammaproteobacteria bacterium]|nr:MAG: hypothetical protein EOO52_15745 [Gammaproteobacteria bacterium]